MQFPQRMLAIERLLIDAHHFGQRVAFAHRVGQLLEMHMVFDRELRVVFHHRVREIQRNFDQPLPIARHQMHPFVEMPEQRVEIDAPLEQSDRSDMQRPALRLAVNKGRVLGRQSIAEADGKLKFSAI